MKHCRNIIYFPVIFRVLFSAPFKSSRIQSSDIMEASSLKEVVLYETYQTLDLAFSERMPRLAQFCPEAQSLHKDLEIMLPYRSAFKVPFDDDTFHVVSEDIFRYTHKHECMYHTYEKILLLGVRKEFDISGPTVMTYHRKACDFVLPVVIVQDIYETPIHLISFAWSCHIPTATIALRIDCLPFSRYEMSVTAYIVFYCCLTSWISHTLKSFGYD